MNKLLQIITFFVGVALCLSLTYEEESFFDRRLSCSSTMVLSTVIKPSDCIKGNCGDFCIDEPPLVLLREDSLSSIVVNPEDTCEIMIECFNGICTLENDIPLPQICLSDTCILVPPAANDTIDIVLSGFTSGGQTITLPEPIIFQFILETQIVIIPGENKVFEQIEYILPEPTVYYLPEIFQKCNTSINESPILTNPLNIDLPSDGDCVKFDVGPLLLSTLQEPTRCIEAAVEKAQQALVTINLTKRIENIINPIITFPCFEIRQEIRVGDFVPPTFTSIPPDQSIECGTFDEKAYRATAVDECTDYVFVGHGCPTYTDPNGNIVHTFLWKAEDRCGNVAGAESTVTELCGSLPPSPTDCEAVTITTSTNKITVANLESPVKNVKVYQVKNDGGWDLVARCTGTECQTTQEFTDLSAGTYIVEVQLFDAHWQEICSFRKFDLLVEGDGGTPSGDCSDIIYQTGENSLTIENLAAPIVDLKVFNRHWQQVFECSAGQCPETVILEDLAGGTHHILTKFYDLNVNNGWEFVCRSTDEVMIPVNADSRNKELVNFDLYPNPAQELVTLDMWEFLDKQVDIRIYNAMSKEVYHQKIEKVTDDILTISLADFTNGMHFINIQAEGLPQVAKKLLVAKLY